MKSVLEIGISILLAVASVRADGGDDRASARDKEAGEESRHTTLDAGAYQITINARDGWRAEIGKEKGTVVLKNSDRTEPDLERPVAKIVLFRVVIPAAARKAAKADIAKELAVADLMGAWREFFGAIPNLSLPSRKGEKGTLFRYSESKDLLRGALDSTSYRFVRAFVLFPEGYSESGAVFVMIGAEQFFFAEHRPYHLEGMERLLSTLVERPAVEEKKPNKAVQPTPTSVMPRANERRIE